MQRMGTRLERAERLAGSGPCLSSSFDRFPLLRFCFARLVSPLFASHPLISSHSTAHTLLSINSPDHQAFVRPLAFDNYNTNPLFFMSMMIIQHHDDGGHDKYRKNMPFVLYNTSPPLPPSLFQQLSSCFNPFFSSSLVVV